MTETHEHDYRRRVDETLGTFLPGTSIEVLCEPRTRQSLAYALFDFDGTLSLVREGWVPDDLAVGDVLATPVTGAYGHSMGSNYNQVLRPAVVFVADGEATRVVRRETYEDLVRREA